jgi:hypothetical protein
MTPAALAAAIVSLLQTLESQGVITIGGWPEQAVTQALTDIGAALAAAFTANPAASVNAPGQSTPPGQDN